MKIAIIGFSGCGKSTLAKQLAKFYDIPVCHLDSYYHMPNWQTRDALEFDHLIEAFMDEHNDWVMDGSYTSHVPSRFKEADVVIYLAYHRFACLKNVIKRYLKYRGQTRPDMGPGCKEKLDWTFVKWVLYRGRTHQKKKKLKAIVASAKQGLIFKSRRSLHRYLKKLGVCDEISM